MASHSPNASPSKREESSCCAEIAPLISATEPASIEASCLTAKRRTLGLILWVTMWLFMDQNILAPNLTDIAKDFNFTDKQRDVKLGGEISLSLFVVGAPVSLIVGYYADRVNRKRLYTVVVLLGEGSMILMLWVEAYWQLFTLRALTGIGDIILLLR